MALCLGVTGIAPGHAPRVFWGIQSETGKPASIREAPIGFVGCVGSCEEMSDTYFAWGLKKISELAGLLSLSFGARYMLLGVPEKMGVKS